MKKYVLPAIGSFLSTYALLAQFHAPLLREYFDDSMDFLTANIYELIGEYHFAFLCVFALCLLLFHVLRFAGKTLTNKVPFIIFSLFAGFSFSLGKFYREAGTDVLLTASFVNVLKFILCTAGFALLIYPVGLSLADLINRSNTLSDSKKTSSFFEKHAFLKAFAILFCFYLPFLVLSFPGNLCYDVIGQIEQVMQNSFSSHHPLLHTLIVGGMTVLGGKLFSSYEIGLFLYVVLQTALLLVSFSTVISYFAKRKIPAFLLWGLLILYCITPIYTNLSTTALKDVPYTAFVLLFVVMYSMVLCKPELAKRSAFHLCFVLIQIGVITMRNNGLPLVVLAGFGAVIFLNIKKPSFAKILHHIGLFFLESIFIAELLLLFLGTALHAEAGSKGEIFSLPFQQSAYYCKYYNGQIPEDEKNAIEGVLGDIHEIASEYDPLIADPVKKLYKKDADAACLFTYLKAYLKGGITHPVLYTKAFLVHTYGWYCPEVSNEIRYETDYETIGHGMLFPGVDKVLVFLYRFAARIFPFGVLENPGFAFWILAFLSAYCISFKRKEGFTLLPHYIGFLVCLASPCFMGHPRYALPLIAGIPFSLLFIVYSKNPQEKEENNVG